MIPPAECQATPAPREADEPPELPPLAALDPKNPLPHWISRTSRAEVFGAYLLGRADRDRVEDQTRDAVAGRCAAWSQRVAAEQAK